MTIGISNPIGGDSITTVPITGGYATKSAMDADVGNIPANAVVAVGRDATVANNGWWQNISGTMTKCLDTDVTVTNRLKADFACGKNKFDSSDPGILTGKYLADNNGSVQTSASYSITGYIHVVAGTTYTVSYKHCMVWYDGSLNIVAISPSTDTAKAQEAPAGAYFLRCSTYTPNYPLSTFQVEVSSTGVPSAYETYHGIPELFSRAVSLEGRASYGPLNLSLGDATEFARAGATLVAGTLGTNAAITLPHLHCLPAVVEWDFKFPADPNLAADAYELLSLNQAGNATPWFKLSLQAKAPTIGYYVPTYAMDCIVVGAATPTTQTFVPPLGPDAFSIRKATPVLADVTIVCEVTADRVKLYNGGTTIGEWLFSGYATVTELTAAMTTDLGADYVVTNYNVAGRVPADLGITKAYLCKAIAEVNATTGVATGATIYDSFETFIPTISTDWHRIRVEIGYYAPNPTWLQISVYMDELRIFLLTNGVNLSTTGMYNLHLNHSTTGGISALAPVKNFSITHTLTPLPRVAVVMTHVFEDGAELPATGGTLKMTSGRLRRVIAEAKKYGWTFGTYDELMDMVLGNKPRRDKMMVFTSDDSRFDWDTQAETKRIFQEHGIKNCTAVITSPGGTPYDFAANAASFLRRRLADNAICSHASIHVNLTTLSYSQFVANVNTAISQFLAAGYDVSSIILPGGATSVEIQRWMLNNGYTISITIASGTAGSAVTYGANRMKFPRTVFDDYVTFSAVTAVLNI